ncbi:MAG: N-acyl homoserine lactonase family protein [Shimia sp.]
MRQRSAVGALPSAPRNPAPRSFDLASGLRLHAIQTGWVAVKRPHRAFAGPDALALPAIALSASWTEWLPVRAWAIEHPEGVIVVHTGETARMADDPGYAACDAASGWFYGSNLRFAVRPEDEVGPQLGLLGIDPARVRTVALTHLHSDHMGGMGWFPEARFLVSAADAGGHPGALLCRIPDRARIEAIRYDGPARDAFAASHALSSDGAIVLVPTPGHTRGHQSVLVQANGRSWLLAGDAAFDLAQIEAGTQAGIVADRAAARDTLTALGRQRTVHGTVILPTHDDGALGRIEGG